MSTGRAWVVSKVAKLRRVEKLMHMSALLQQLERLKLQQQPEEHVPKGPCGCALAHEVLLRPHILTYI